jgi:hypothetical protein
MTARIPLTMIVKAGNTIAYNLSGGVLVSVGSGNSRKKWCQFFLLYFP